MAEESTQSPPATPKKMGCGTVIAVFVIAVLLFGWGLNSALGYYYEHCNGGDVLECFTNRAEEKKPVGAVAKGTYTYKDYSADFTLYIPLDGGTVTGKIEGTCDGTAKGNFSGQNNGNISGTMAGACDPFYIKIPASGSFNGTVDKDKKTVRLNITGKGAGVEKSDSMTLTYQ